MLIPSHRHRPDDITRWEYYEKVDALVCRTRLFHIRVEEAKEAIRKFAKAPCYVGVSWGKDSTVLAHLVQLVAPDLPLIWVRVNRIFNPDCPLVRDRFIAAFPDLIYSEIDADCLLDEADYFSTTGAETGFEIAKKRYGRRYISGVRGDESGVRKVRMRAHGLISKNTCAPMGWWRGEEVYAYLYLHKLPVHPAYACSQGGLWERDRLRVASIGGPRGQEFGRAEWERYYYPEVRVNLG